MRCLTLLFAALACACASTPAPSGDKLAIAKRIAEHLGSAAVLEAEARAYLDEYARDIPSYDALCQDAHDRQTCERVGQEINAEIRDTLDAAIVWLLPLRPHMIDGDAEVMADTYTEAELRAYLAFLDSPEGLSMTAKVPRAYPRLAESKYGAYRPWTNILASMVSLVYERHRTVYENSIAGK